MDKFLDLVEDHTPDDSVDRNTKAKLTLLRVLLDKGVKVKNRPMSNFLHIMDDEGNKYKVSIDNVEDAEDQETETANTTKDVELAAATAKKAVERREKVIKAQLPKKIAEYEAATNELEK